MGSEVVYGGVCSVWEEWDQNRQHDTIDERILGFGKRNLDG